MNFFRGKRNKKITIVVLIAAAMLVGSCALYLNDYYHADMDAIVEMIRG